MRSYSVKEKAGCLFLDIPRLLPALCIEDRWISACNRQDALKVEHGGVDTTAIGQSSVDIYACHVFPWIGKRLMQQALKQWSFSFSDKGRNENEKPEISFIIPHRGKERLPVLCKVIKSILAQVNVAVEVIVVEQGVEQEVEGLPGSVQYIHLPHPQDPEGWYKSWAFNVGASQAQADILVCHDGDILVPTHYADEIMNRIVGEGYEVAHLYRFLFCLGRLSTNQTLEMQHKILTKSPPIRVRQNWCGGTLAIKKDSYFGIGGFDERFTGWSSEDREFYDRCLVLNGYRSGYIPFIHLWHPEQSTKQGEDRETNLDFSDKIMTVPREQRIDQLKKFQQL